MAGSDFSEMSQIELSVIIPMFNSAQYLRAFLHSLGRQEVAQAEFIVVDDGSTDASSAILEEFSRTDNRIIVLKQPNSGSSAARNLALGVARGEWIAFADCDDWLPPGALATRLARAKAMQADVLICNGFKFAGTPDERGVPMFERQPWGETLSGWDWIKRASRVCECPHYVWLQLVRRSFLEAHRLRFEEGILHQDILWTVELALTNGTFAFTGDAHYGYRDNPGSVTNSQSLDALFERARSYVRVMQRLAQSARRAGLDLQVQRALLHQINRESRHFYGLLHRRIKDSQVRGRLARSFLSLDLQRAVLAGSTRPRELWHALRCTAALRSYASAKPC